MTTNDKYNCMIIACEGTDWSATHGVCTKGNCAECYTRYAFFEAHFDYDGNIDYLYADLPLGGYTSKKHRKMHENYMAEILTLANAEFSAVPNGIRITDKGKKQMLEVISFRCGAVDSVINFVRNTTPDKAVIAMGICVKDTEDLLPEVRSFMRKAVEHTVNCGLFILSCDADEEV